MRVITYSFVYFFIYSLFRSLVRLFVYSFVHSLINSLLFHLHFIHSLFRSFVCSFIDSFVRSFVVGCFARSLGRSFINSLIHSSVHSYRCFLRAKTPAPTLSRERSTYAVKCACWFAGTFVFIWWFTVKQLLIAVTVFRGKTKAFLRSRKHKIWQLRNAYYLL